MTIQIKEIDTFDLTNEEYATYTKFYGGTIPAFFYVKLNDGELVDMHKRRDVLEKR